MIGIWLNYWKPSRKHTLKFLWRHSIGSWLSVLLKAYICLPWPIPLFLVPYVSISPMMCHILENTQTLLDPRELSEWGEGASRAALGYNKHRLPLSGQKPSAAQVLELSGHSIPQGASLVLQTLSFFKVQCRGPPENYPYPRGEVHRVIELEGALQPI